MDRFPNPVFSEEGRSSLVSAGILAKVVSHPKTVNLGKEDDDGSEKEEGADDLEQGVIPEQQSLKSSDNISPTNP